MNERRGKIRRGKQSREAIKRRKKRRAAHLNVSANIPGELTKALASARNEPDTWTRWGHELIEEIEVAAAESPAPMHDPAGVTVGKLRQFERERILDYNIQRDKARQQREAMVKAVVNRIRREEGLKESDVLPPERWIEVDEARQQALLQFPDPPPPDVLPLVPTTTERSVVRPGPSLEAVRSAVERELQRAGLQVP